MDQYPPYIHHKYSQATQGHFFSRCVPSRNCNRCLDPDPLPPGYATGSHHGGLEMSLEMLVKVRENWVELDGIGWYSIFDVWWCLVPSGFLGTRIVFVFGGVFGKSFSAVEVIISICGHRVKHGWFYAAVPFEPFEPWMLFLPNSSYWFQKGWDIPISPQFARLVPEDSISNSTESLSIFRAHLSKANVMSFLICLISVFQFPNKNHAKKMGLP